MTVKRIITYIVEAVLGFLGVKLILQKVIFALLGKVFGIVVILLIAIVIISKLYKKYFLKY